ncbi:hypothetical protein HMN09_00233500 [Mycena chlorophos]|uniref:DUF7330 domain-containing protein n=1 Tax=Mycena chlorophos TaxID=658473 RepID=A0A8H6TK23_MYCCL|nr:hypothetical protein HMN09_00233500 [Mycena chlorophos]
MSVNRDRDRDAPPPMYSLDAEPSSPVEVQDDSFSNSNLDSPRNSNDLDSSVTACRNSGELGSASTGLPVPGLSSSPSAPHLPMAIPTGNPLPTRRPQRRPTTASGIPASSEVRLSMFPDHNLKLLHQRGPRRRLSSSTATSSTANSVASAGTFVTTATTTNASANTETDTARDPAPLNLNPTNFVSVFRKTHKRAFSLNLSRGSASIKGSFAVNPFLDIPVQLLSPLPAGETGRKNLQLKVENGGIDVDVYVLGEPQSQSPPNTTSNGLSGSVVPVKYTELHFEVCAPVPTAPRGPDNAFPLLARIYTPTIRRPPCRLTLISQNGFVSLHLPPSFHGLLRVTVAAGDLNDHITLSAVLTPHATILSEDSTSRTYFVGALAARKWEGDRAEVNVHGGKVRIQFSGSGERDLDGLRRVGWDLMHI